MRPLLRYCPLCAHKKQICIRECARVARPAGTWPPFRAKVAAFERERNATMAVARTLHEFHAASCSALRAQQAEVAVAACEVCGPRAVAVSAAPPAGARARA